MNRSRIISLILLTLLLSFGVMSCAGEQEAAPVVEKAAEVVVEKAAEVVQVDPVEQAALAYFADKAEDNNMIAQDAFIEKVKAGGDFMVLDIRSAADYEKGHVIGAVNAPWGPAVAENMSKLPDDKTIYLYCYSGQTAGQTTALLNVAGFDVKSVRYGFNLGISKVEGYEEVIETTPNFFDAINTKVDPAIEAAVVNYFNTLAEDPDTKNNIISSTAAKAMMDASEGGDLVILSIRQTKDYDAGHIAGAINIPWAKGMQTQFDTLPKDKQILVYCYSGQTAGQTVAILKLLGYDAASIKSGMGTAGTGGSGWGIEGFDVVL
ncbi:MAG: rhodanese-like domain-containing protein [Spirochaetia bacterium]|nr:rhodanese-like domain-containing protein [Spirochaetia bacterium]